MDTAISEATRAIHQALRAGTWIPGHWHRWCRGAAMTGGGGQIQVVQVRGELDLALADSLAVRGYAAIGRQARVLLLDLAGVSFCDACGLSALVRIANHADRAGCRYGLIAPQPPVVKVLRITGLDQRLPIFTSVHEAAIVLGYDSQTTLEEPDDQ